MYVVPRAACYYNDGATGGGAAADFSIANNVATAIKLWLPRFPDPTGYWNAANPTRLTIPADGTYFVGGGVQFASASDGKFRAVFVRVNGTTTIVTNSGPAPNISAQTHTRPVAKPRRFVAGDYIELVAFQGSGAASTIVYAAEESPELWIVPLEPQVVA